MERENYAAIASLEQGNWWYRSRRELIRSLLRGKRFECALDAGSGTGSNFSVLSELRCRVYGLDPIKEAIDHCRGKPYDDLLQEGIEETSYPDRFFDLVLCCDVLEHTDDRKAVGEIARISKKGGLVIVTVPAHQYLWHFNDDFSQHRKRYEKRNIAELFSEDFHIRLLRYWNFLFYVPLLGYAKLARGTRHENNLNILPRFLNGFLLRLMRCENYLGSPNGVSIIGVMERK